MKKSYTYICFAIVLLSFCNVNATKGYHCPYDNIAMALSGDSVVKSEGHRAGHYGYNAIDSAMQNRFRYSDSVHFSNRTLFSHLYVGPLFGYEAIVPRGGNEFAPATNIGFMIGKDVARFHTLSLAAKYGEYHISNAREYEMKKYSLQANYYFNVSRYFWGYNPYRFVEFSPTLGVGFQRSTIKGDSYNSAFALLGVEAKINLGDRMNLRIQPYVALSTDGVDASEKTNWNRYDVLYGGDIALSYVFDNEVLSQRKSELKHERAFFDLSLGLQALDCDIDFTNTIGPAFGVGLGYWIDSRIAMRLSCGFSLGKWYQHITAEDVQAGHPEYVYNGYSSYVFGRLEAMINLLSTTGKHPFATDMLLGYEYGRQWKWEYETFNICSYSGLTAALRLKYGIGDSQSLFLEPRITFMNYGIPYNAPYQYLKKYYTDTKYNLSLGMEFSSWPKKKNTSSDDVTETAGFTPKLSVSLLGGSDYFLRYSSYDGDNSVNLSVGAAVEYQPFSALGARVMLQYETLYFNNIYSFEESYPSGGVFNYQGLWQKEHKLLALGADIKLDLTTLFYSYQPQRRWELDLYLGVVVNKQIDVVGKINSGELLLDKNSSPKLKDDDFDKSYHLAYKPSFAVNYNLNNHYKVFTEFGLRLYKNNFFKEKGPAEAPVMFTMNLGVSYTF